MNKQYKRHIKQILHTLLIAVSSVFLIPIKTNAQVPQGINYQAVARNDSGQILIETELDIRISLPYAGFYETHEKIKTNKFGLFTLVIGTKNPNDFDDINWGGNVGELKIEVRKNGESDYQTLNTNNTLQSVPYALYSDKSKNAEQHGLADEDLDKTNELINTMNYNVVDSQFVIQITEGNGHITSLPLNPFITIITSAVQDTIENDPLTNDIIYHLQNDSDLVIGNELITNAIYDSSSHQIIITEGSNNHTIFLPPSNNTDNQLLDIVGDTLKISGGNSVTLPSYAAGLGLSLLTSNNIHTLNVNNGNGLEIVSPNKLAVKSYNGLTTTAAGGVGLGGTLFGTTDIHMNTQSLNFNMNTGSSSGTYFSIKNISYSPTVPIFTVSPRHVGIKNQNPTVALDIIGSTKISDSLLVGTDANDLFHAKAKVKLEGFANINSTVHFSDRILVWRGQSQLIDTIPSSAFYTSPNNAGSGLNLLNNAFNWGGNLTEDAVIKHNTKKVEFQLGNSTSSFFEINKAPASGSPIAIVFKAESDGDIQLGSQNTTSNTTTFYTKIEPKTFSSDTGKKAGDKFLIVRSNGIVDTLDAINSIKLISLLSGTSIGNIPAGTLITPLPINNNGCPNNMGRVVGIPFTNTTNYIPQNYCVDLNHQTAQKTYLAANNDCQKNGKRLCDADELLFIFSSEAKVLTPANVFQNVTANSNDFEWSADVHNENKATRIKPSFFEDADISTEDNYYRCCYTIR